MIQVQARNGLCTLTLSRPDRRNALTAEGLEALRSAIEATTEPVLVVCGAGDAFCAGADLDEVGALGPEEASEFAALGQTVARALATYEGATVAAIDGAVRGGGLDLALACDVRACTPESTFAASGVTIGLLGAWGGTIRLPAVVGPSVAADLALTGREVDAEAALRTGLVSRVTDDPESVAREIADHESIPVRTIATRLRDRGPPGDDVAGLEAREREAFAALVRRHTS